MTLSIIFSGASLILCGFFFIYFTLYIKRRTKRANILGDYQDEVNKLIADIDSATDRDLTLVEARIAALKKLLEDVDKRIALLNREQDRKRGGEAVYTRLGRQMKVTVQEPAPVAPVSAPEPPASPVLSGEKAPPAPVNPVPADRKGAGSRGEAPPAPAANPAPAGDAAPAAVVPKELSFAERVAELSRAGFAPGLIAARLGVSLYEVELAIAVYRKKHAAPKA
ncbi:hypothetical protein AGMMS49546_19540 [Spirochaetia bacterium]|nr:hypothetical protein AGMMS49546_19540 [Spirochaetia bacterium]